MVGQATACKSEVPADSAFAGSGALRAVHVDPAIVRSRALDELSPTARHTDADGHATDHRKES
jgi:hypothetical protein